MSRYIQKLISQGEHQQLDFKYEISDAPKLARTFSAFANTNGGRLLIGVKDNGNISGIKTDEEAYMAEASANLYCKPPVPFEIVPHKIKDKVVLEIIVPESKLKPHKAPWKGGKLKSFVRVKDENFVANDVIEEVWRIKRTKGAKVKYKGIEENLFSLLREQGEITLRDFVKHCKVKPYLAKKILANMISIDVIDIRITENEAFYKLK